MSELPIEVGALVGGKYRVERVIGRGGMGVVVAAVHEEIDQRVAIKFLSSEAAKTKDAAARFSREAKAAARIKNEHAVKVFDVGRLEDGSPYMVMEFLDGMDLDGLLESRRTVPIEEAADYLLQACEALAEAHLFGIVHRDLKPANLFLSHRSDGSTCVKILDFGISKVDEGGALSTTQTTSLVGSPLYMSPERMRGSKEVDRRADIWALGVMLQEMLTGDTPFVAETIPEIHALVLTSEPIGLRKHLPTAPDGLEELILKCLEKAPDARFQSVQEFAAALVLFAPSLQPCVDRIVRIGLSGSGRRSFSSGSDAPPERVSSISPDGAASGPNPDLTETANAPQDATTGVAGAGASTTVRKKRKSTLAAAAVITALVLVGALTLLLSSNQRKPAPLTSTATTTAGGVSPGVAATQPAVVPPVATQMPAPSDAATTAVTAPSSSARDATPSASGSARHRRGKTDAGAALPDNGPVVDDSGFVDYGGRN